MLPKTVKDLMSLCTVRIYPGSHASDPNYEFLLNVNKPNDVSVSCYFRSGNIYAYHHCSGAFIGCFSDHTSHAYAKKLVRKAGFNVD